MGDVFQVKVTGLRELGEAFKALQADMQRKAGQAGTNAAAQAIKKIAKKRAPVADADYKVSRGKGDPGVVVPAGNIVKKLSVKGLRSSTPGFVESIVYIKAKRKDGYANRIAALNEFGTVKQPAKPFLRPALAEGASQAVEAMKKRLATRIEKATPK